MAAWIIAVLLIVTPFIVLTDIKEGFRLPQGLATGWLGLASLFAASFVLRDVASIPLRPAEWWRLPAVRALVPLAAVVAVGAFTTSHSAHFRAAFIDFAMGVACVIGWSLALGAPAMRRLLVWTIPPAVLVAALGVDQAFGWFGTLDFLNVQAPTARLRITSTIGNPGDLAGMLVLPSLMAVEEIANASRRLRMLLAGALVVMTAAIIVTATLAAVAAIVVGLVLWTVPRLWPGGDASAPAAIDSTVFRRRRMAVLLAGALVLVLAVAGLAASTPLRARVSEKVMQLASGDLNAVLTGRLDGWRAAWAMLRAKPVSGVGQGAFRAEYADTRLALEAKGVTFLAEQQQVVMATPHNEALSVAAEQGVPGLVALAWAIWCAIISAARMSDRHHDRTLALAGLTALGVLSLVSFPLHVPAIAWPWLLLFAWIFRSAAERESAGAGAGSERRRPRMTGRQLFPIVAIALAAALAAQTLRARNRLEAGRLLAQVEARTMAAVQAKRAPSTMFAENLSWLDRAAQLDPLEIGIPIARGTQYLLLRRADEAIAAYRDAAALEPRPEIDLNLGRALWMRGDKEAARKVLQRAVQLNPALRAEVPSGSLD